MLIGGVLGVITLIFLVKIFIVEQGDEWEEDVEAVIFILITGPLVVLWAVASLSDYVYRKGGESLVIETSPIKTEYLQPLDRGGNTYLEVNTQDSLAYYLPEGASLRGGYESVNLNKFYTEKSKDSLSNSSRPCIKTYLKKLGGRKYLALNPFKNDSIKVFSYNKKDEINYILNSK